MPMNFTTHDDIINRAGEHLNRIAVNEELDWRTLFGEPEWEKITSEFNAQQVGRLLGSHFTGGDHPVIQFLRVGSAPRRSIFRKIREFKARG